MGPALDPAITAILMLELEIRILPTLRKHVSPWKTYVDNTISYMKEESNEHVLIKLNGYHDNIKFTYEIQTDGVVRFLDVLVIPKEYEVEATLYKEKLPTMYLSSLEVIFFNNIKMRNASDISFISLQSVFQQPAIAK